MDAQSENKKRGLGSRSRESRGQKSDIQIIRRERILSNDSGNNMGAHRSVPWTQRGREEKHETLQIACKMRCVDASVDARWTPGGRWVRPHGPHGPWAGWVSRSPLAPILDDASALFFQTTSRRNFAPRACEPQLEAVPKGACAPPSSDCRSFPWSRRRSSWS